jgi:hypothetical protein
VAGLWPILFVYTKKAKNLAISAEDIFVESTENK